MRRISDTCKFCSNISSSSRCARCKPLEQAGWRVLHDGPIRAGDYYEGIDGFVWDVVRAALGK